MKPARLIVGTIAVLLFALFCWPTRWRYEQLKVASERSGHIERGPGSVLVRIDRVNGEVWTMTPGIGWVHQSHDPSPLSSLVDQLIQEDHEEQARKR